MVRMVRDDIDMASREVVSCIVHTYELTFIV